MSAASLPACSPFRSSIRYRAEATGWNPDPQPPRVMRHAFSSGPRDREEPMTVARIINEKGRNVVTVAPEASLAEIAALLSEKRIGAILVVEKEAIRGIVSERDIVRALAKHGSEALRKVAAE